MPWLPGLALLAFVLFGSGPVTAAQPPAVAGAWTVSIEAAKDPAGAARTRSRNAMTATMTLKVSGTEVTGSWQAAPGGPVSVKGTWKNGQLDLESAVAEASGSDGSKRVKIQLRWLIRGAIRDGRLAGTCAVIFGRDDDPLWSRWVATRRE